MKTFAQWMQTGPLANEPLTQRQRMMLEIAFLEGRGAQIDENIAALERIAVAGVTEQPATATGS